jgi:hypothetical protein
LDLPPFQFAVEEVTGAFLEMKTNKGAGQVDCYVTPIFKAGIQNNVTNYHGIAIL